MSRAPFVFFHPSNLLTYASVVFAWAAVVQAIGGAPGSLIGGCLLLSAVCDMLDGRFARFSERWWRRDPSQRNFGVQIDSLADAVTFGLAPATIVVLRAITRGPLTSALIAVALAYVLCVLTRLGQFNVALLERWEGASRGFIGLPTTYAGLAWGIWFGFAVPGGSSGYGVLIGLSLLMILPLPIPRPRGWLFVLIVGSALLLATALMATKGVGA